MSELTPKQKQDVESLIQMGNGEAAKAQARLYQTVNNNKQKPPDEPTPSKPKP